MAYLDHNATSPLRPEARAALARALDLTGNPSSVHSGGRAARALVEEAREDVARLMNARAQDVIFTSGGTEANALALIGAVQGAAEAGERITRLFVSAIEHDSILANAEALAERSAGLRLEFIPVTPDGAVDLDALRVMLREGKGRTLIAVMAANNETGVVQPLDEVSRLAKENGALLLIDAVQAAGRIAIDFGSLGASYLSLSAHKLGGSHGTGALILREGVPFATLIAGGGQERGHRAGTENVAGIAGFGAVAKDFGDTKRIGALRERFERALLKAAPETIVFGARAERLANTSNFALPGIAAETALIALDLDGVQVSSGAACSSGKVKPSHVLSAMGVGEETARCALRVSFGWNSTEADADAAIASLSNLVAHSARRAA
jgi:cysteine desulfurase